MISNSDELSDFSGCTEGSGKNLRRRAEEKIGAMEAENPENTSPEAAKRLLHELRVHQIELEMQNEELLRTQEELEASRARYFSLYDLAPIGYVTINEPGFIVEANLTAASMLDASRAALVHQPLSHFVVSEDQNIYYFYRKQLVATSAPQVCELRMLRQDGHSFWVRLDATLAISEKSGATVCRVTMCDITERKRAEEEREKLQGELLHAKKMEVAGRFAGGIAHDFNNMLQVILGNIELALGTTSPTSKLCRYLTAAQEAAGRSAKFVRKLMALACKQIVAQEVLDLNDYISKMLNILRPLVGEGIKMVWVPGANLGLVKTAPTHIDQILTNLSLNARDAIAGVGEIRIKTENVTFTCDKAGGSHYAGGIVPGAYVMLELSDNGCGMDKSTVEHLFEPFFTTKGVGKGTGLGLATVYGIVKQNRGFIDISSEPGHGTTIRIYLPKSVEESAKTCFAPGKQEAQGGSETVLLVDDETMLLEIGKGLLQTLGYRVLTSGTPEEALQLVKSYAGDIHLLISDVMMPEMNGRKLAERIKESRPGIKCLFISGYSADEIAHCGILDKGLLFLQKPFSFQSMASKVREALEQKS